MGRNAGTLLVTAVVVTALLGACGGENADDGGFVRTYVIPAVAMAPTFNKGDRVIVELDAYRGAEPSRGDVVVFVGPDSWGEVAGGKVIKRVIAVGGDTVQCCDAGNRLVLNGAPLIEPYLGDAPLQQTFFGPIKVPDGRFWAMGDNRPYSADSRMFVSDLDNGTVPMDAVLGRVQIPAEAP